MKRHHRNGNPARKSYETFLSRKNYYFQTSGSGAFLCAQWRDRLRQSKHRVALRYGRKHAIGKNRATRNELYLVTIVRDRYKATFYVGEEYGALQDRENEPDEFVK